MPKTNLGKCDKIKLCLFTFSIMYSQLLPKLVYAVVVVNSIANFDIFLYPIYGVVVVYTVFLYLMRVEVTGTYH